MFTKLTTSRLLAGLLMPVLSLSIACCGGSSTTKTFTSNDSTGGSSRDTILVNGKLRATVPAPASTSTKLSTANDSTGGSSRDTTLLKKN